MKTLLIAVATLGLVGLAAVQAQDAKPAESAEKPKVSQEELEGRFQRMLTKAVLNGRWAPIDNMELGPEKKGDKYEIVSAGKVKGDQWVVNAKMRYGKNEFVMPVPVQVKWSGETPMLIVDNLSMGGDKKYSARVLFFEGTYSGSWSSSAGYGGVIYGMVERAPIAQTEEKKSDQK
jgi:hypothetical protein